jgi:EAL domain-containing protein (putative c-di-GMP-specific phosphodiesterase class I)
MRLTSELGLVVTAAGIDAPDAQRMMSELGCTLGFGAATGPELRPDEVRGYLAR